MLKKMWSPHPNNTTMPPARNNSKWTTLSFVLMSFCGVIVGAISSILCIVVEDNLRGALWGFISAFIAGCVLVLNLENTIFRIKREVIECVLPYFGLLGVIACGASVFFLAKYTAIAEEKRNKDHTEAVPEYIASSVTVQALCWSIFLIWNVFYVEKFSRKNGYKYEPFSKDADAQSEVSETEFPLPPAAEVDPPKQTQV